MNAESLRASILQAAVQGKLVPQDPIDVPASVIIDQIRDEKERFVHDGVIKKDKFDSLIYQKDGVWLEKINKDVSPIDVPYDLPSGWTWARLSSLTENVEGSIADGPFGSDLKTEHYTTNREVRIIQLSNLDDGAWRDGNRKYTTFGHAAELSRCLVDPFDIVIAKMMPAGRSTIVPDIESKYILASDVIKFKPHPSLDKKYVCYAINSSVFRSQITSQIHGQGRIRTSVNKVRTYLLPVPPLEEQKRIVAKIEELQPLIESFDENQLKLSELNSSIASILRKSILQAAIKGKLVPQDPDDVPASSIIDQIRAEKERLIHDGMIKNDKFDSLIYQKDGVWLEKINKDVSPIDVPYDLPSGWTWARLSSLTENVDGSIADGPFGSDLKTEHYTTNREVRIIQLSNLDDGAWRDSNRKYTSFEHAAELSRCLVDPFDIVIAKMMPAGRATIVPDIESKYILASDVIKFKPHPSLDKEYICYAINSSIFRSQISSQIHGQGRIRTSVNKVRTYLLPIPPLAEQKRIVAKIEESMSLIGKLEQ